MTVLVLGLAWLGFNVVVLWLLLGLASTAAWVWLWLWLNCYGLVL